MNCMFACARWYKCAAPVLRLLTYCPLLPQQQARMRTVEPLPTVTSGRSTIEQFTATEIADQVCERFCVL